VEWSGCGREGVKSLHSSRCRNRDEIVSNLAFRVYCKVVVEWLRSRGCETAAQQPMQKSRRDS
jgi:hypothetical protein